MKWDELDFWTSQQWIETQEKIDALETDGRILCPSRSSLFRALDLCSFDSVRVMLCGQDPYPDPECATGLAFEVPPLVRKLPPTLKNILTEYNNDLHYPVPSSPDLSIWAERGVLLWNVIPSCEAFDSLVHAEWEGWRVLSQEIITKLRERNIVFAFLGGVAQRYAEYADDGFNHIVKRNILTTSHPSPRGARAGGNPFVGSRLFSTINGLLVDQELEPINWQLSRLPDIQRKLPGLQERVVHEDLITVHPQ